MIVTNPSYTYKEAGDVANNKDVDSTPFAFVSTYNIGIFYVLWYFFLTEWNLVNYVAWVRFNADLLDGKPPTEFYLILCVLAHVAYWLIGGGLFIRAAKYATDNKDRNRYLTAGIATLYFLTDVPLWMADVTIFYFYGLQNEIPAIVFFLRSISFLFNSIVTWHIYMHRIVKFLHQRLWVGRVDVREIATRKAKDMRLKEIQARIKAQKRADKANEDA